MCALLEPKLQKCHPRNKRVVNEVSVKKMIETQKRFRLRFTYVKQGRLAHLSHLEITRALERAIRRAELPFGVSQGFSPHMLLSFGSALPVGVGSTCEIFDVMLKDHMRPDVALEKMQNAIQKDLMVTKAELIGIKETAASNAFSTSVYVATYDGEIPDFEVPETIEVVRKKQMKVLNVDDYLVEMPIIEGQTIQCSLRISQSGTLRIDKLLNSFNIDSPLTSITRIEQF